MTTAHTTEHKKDLVYNKAFFSRVFSHVREDLLAAYNIINLVIIAILGTLLFLWEFPLVKEFLTYVVIIPFSIFIAVKYFTLLPTIFFFFFLFIAPRYAAISLSVISVFSFIWVLLV